MTGRLSAIRSVAPQLLASAELVVETPGEGFTDITREAAHFVEQSEAGDGVLLFYLRHTSASLVIQENADRDVQADLITALHRLAPTMARGCTPPRGPTTCQATSKPCWPAFRSMCRCAAASSRSAPGRAFIWSSTGHGRTGAR